MFNNSKPLALIAIALTASLVGCKEEGPQPPETHSISHATGTYSDPFDVEVYIPEDAANVYISTDMVDPFPSENCVLATGSTQIHVDRPMAVKIRYDHYSDVVTDTRYFFVESNAGDGGYKNRDLLEVWEHFFLKDVIQQFNIPNEDHSILTLEDGQGGSVSLETNITKRGFLWDDPEEGNQTYRFDNFHGKDPFSKKELVINAGEIYGFRGENSGYYNTEVDGATIEFSGVYNGYAEGNFQMNGEGETTSGYYRVFCEDLGCAPSEIVYGLDSSRTKFIEINPANDPNVISCNTPLEDPEATE